MMGAQHAGPRVRSWFSFQSSRPGHGRIPRNIHPDMLPARSFAAQAESPPKTGPKTVPF